MKRTNLINVICSLILASVLVLGILMTVVIYSSGDGRLVIESESAQMEYNGNALERHSYSVRSGSLKNGHKVEASFTGTQTEIGTSENSFSVRIVDKDGNDVTARYSIKLVYGKLNVTPITITIETPTADKAYDGTPLVCAEWIHKGMLLPGHKLSVYVGGSQTEVGVSPNKVDRYSITDSNGYDVSNYYNVILHEGDLVVYDPIQMGGTVGGGSSVDLSGQIGGAESGESNTVCIKVKNDVSDLVYLKLKSFGAYKGRSWGEAEPYNQLINGKMSADYLSSLAINNTFSRVEIESFTDQYFLPYYMSATDTSSYNVQTSDVFYSGNTKNIYAVSYGKFDYKEALTLPRAYRPYEQAYRTFVYEKYLDIDAQTLEYMQGIIDKEGFYKKDIAMVLEVAEYIQNSARYTKSYNREVDSRSNVAVAFLDEYKEGICQHFASAATLLYRAMGIPARYTIGFLVETQEGTWVDVKGESAHAWVEVYIDGMGWIEVEVTGGYDGSGGGGGEPAYLATVSPVRVEKLYDGTPLYAENEVNGFEKFEKMGYTYKAVISGSQTELGKSKSVIESFTVYDRYGNDVTNEFNITFNTGTVHVYKAELVFKSSGATKEYDGLPLETDLSTCILDGTLGKGEFYEISNPASIVNAMTVSANFKVVIRNKSGIDITDFYKITKHCGTLKITPRNITVKAADATKKYDGRVLVDQGYTVIGELAVDEFLVCVVDGSQKSVGRSENIVKEVFIYNALGGDVTINYSIKLETGTLRVTP